MTQLLLKNPKKAKRKPNIALLSVTRRIEDEAAQVLYGKNVWRISNQKNDPSWPDLAELSRVHGFSGHLDLDYTLIDIENDAEYIHELRKAKLQRTWIWEREKF